MTEDSAGQNKSFWEQAREARHNNDGWVRYFLTMATITSVTACGTCVMVIAFLIPFLAVVVGVSKYDECPVNDMIPVYLIAVGLVGVISSSLGLSRHCTDKDNIKTQKCIACLQIPLSIVWIGFFIAGNIWVYGALSRVETDAHTVKTPGGKPNPNYCDPWVYWLAFFMITMVYVIIVLLSCMCCAVGVAVAKSSPEEIPLAEMTGQEGYDATEQSTPQPAAESEVQEQTQ